MSAQQSPGREALRVVDTWWPQVSDMVAVALATVDRNPIDQDGSTRSAVMCVVYALDVIEREIREHAPTLDNDIDDCDAASLAHLYVGHVCRWLGAARRVAKSCIDSDAASDLQFVLWKAYQLTESTEINLGGLVDEARRALGQIVPTNIERAIAAEEGRPNVH